MIDSILNSKVESLKLTPEGDNPLIETGKYSDDFFDKYVEEYINFTYENPTIFHAVNYFSKLLEEKGFTYISEKTSWELVKPGKYYTTRNETSLVTFVVGKDWSPDRGFGIIGSHIDSLTTVLKPISKKEKIDGYELLGVAPYAHNFKEVWWDRDLGIGGRILTKDPKKGTISSKLVNSTPQPIAKIPSLAPHFGAPSVGPFDPETRAVPVIGYSGDSKEDDATDEEKKAPLYGKHPLKLLRYISSLANVSVPDIIQWDLQLFDVQKGVRGGLEKELLFAPRLDDKLCSFAAIYALLEGDVDGGLENDTFSVVALFDNEEVGSGTRTGVKGGLLELVLGRVLSSKYFSSEPGLSQEQLLLALSNSIILSADVNHLVNPNFTDLYLENHKPVPNKGITIATDPSAYFATDSVGIALLTEIAKKNGDQLQFFQRRNGTASGTSIGPLISFQTGSRTIDVGIPQLSMHSIRATTGAKDVGLGIKFFEGFFKEWRNIYDSYTDL